jgi:hypothetical protein
LRSRLEAVELLEQPALTIRRRLLIRAGAESKAIERDRCRKHPRLLDAELAPVRLNRL